MSVTVLCGGVGAARFLGGLVEVVDPAEITAIVNTGDDTVMHGLAISPDLDTIIYTLAAAIDRDRGWGLAGETWAAVEALERYEAVRPAGSAAAATWFSLGDRDLATHLYRTARLAEGATLTTVTAEIAAAWGVTVDIVPMANEPVATIVELASGQRLAFQEYFVKHRHEPPVRGVSFESPDRNVPAPTAATLAAIDTAATIVIAPSNPIVSIGPIRALPGVDEHLAARRADTVAVSPIVGGKALKGPADRMLEQLGHEASVVGVARLYRDVAAALVIDPVDAELADAVRAVGVEPIVVPSVMATPQLAADLARATVFG